MLAPGGKVFIAASMYDKGRSFIGAAILLAQHGGHPGVVRHLLCQGIEIILKAMLLRRDYDQYALRLSKLGHNLLRVVGAARSATGLHLFMHGAQAELAELGKFYSATQLRYGGPIDIFIDQSSIPVARTVRHCRALLTYLERTGYFR